MLFCLATIVAVSIQQMSIMLRCLEGDFADPSILLEPNPARFRCFTMRTVSEQAESWTITSTYIIHCATC